MQKRFISLLFIAAVCTMVFVGCKKDTEVVTLGVQNEISSNGKVYIDGSYNPCFLQSGEQVNVNGAPYDVVYSNGQYKVSCQSNTDGNYYAVYPATNSCTGGTCTITLPHFQQYDCDASGVQNVKLPAGATILNNSGTKLYFYNLCSLLEVQWTNTSSTAYQVTGIEVTVPGKAIWGTGTATLAGTSSTLVMDESNNKDKSNNRVILSIPTNKRETVAATNGVSRKYYIVLPTFDSKRVLVNVRVADPNSANGQKVLSIKMSTQSAVDMQRNYIVPLHLSNAPTQDNELSGYFSVSQNLKVVFSRGNLQHVGTTSHSTGTWKFADRQYDYFGHNNYSNGGWNSTANRDLFAWSTTTSEDYGVSVYDDWSDEDAGTFVEWGKKAIQSRTNANGEANVWFTLTSDEWEYLINERVVVNGVPKAPQLRGRATISGVLDHPSGNSTIENTGVVRGFILLPDDWEADDLPEGLSFSYNSVNEYTLSQWASMEAAGALFLPAAGWGDAWGDEGNFVNEEYRDGAYWSSTAWGGYGDSYWVYFNYNTNEFLRKYNYDAEWYCSKSVRLVKAAPGYTVTGRWN